MQQDLNKLCGTKQGARHYLYHRKKNHQPDYTDCVPGHWCGHKGKSTIHYSRKSQKSADRIKRVLTTKIAYSEGMAVSNWKTLPPCLKS